MKTTWKKTLLVAGMALAAQAGAQVTLYSGEGFRGPSFLADDRIGNLEREGFNDRASSAVVQSGEWQVCEDARFNGRCAVLQPGEYPDLGRMGLDNRISSIRPVNAQARNGNDRGYAVADNDRWRRHGDERVYEVPVSSVRAVVGPPERRCWVERQTVAEGGRGDPNIPGAVIGGVLGGILGHQIGGGRGQDVATVGGAIAGTAIGSNVNRGGGAVTQDVQRCSDVSNAAPDYYDVTYYYRGQEHHVQTTTPPGRTLIVNADGEPRLQ